jgi:hypothetical protein
MLHILDTITPDTVITEIREVVSQSAPDETALEEVFYESVPSVVVEGLLKWTRSTVEEGGLSDDTADPSRSWALETPRGDLPQYESTPRLEEEEAEDDRVPDIPYSAEPDEVHAEIIDGLEETPARNHENMVARRLVTQEPVVEQRATRSKGVPEEGFQQLVNGEKSAPQASGMARSCQMAASSEEIGDSPGGIVKTKTTPADRIENVPGDVRWKAGYTNENGGRHGVKFGHFT